MWFAAAPIQALVTRRYKMTAGTIGLRSPGSAALPAEEPAQATEDVADAGRS